jgi:hypothetical protein
MEGEGSSAYESLVKRGKLTKEYFIAVERMKLIRSTNTRA